MKCPVCNDIHITYQGKSVNSDVQILKCDKCDFVGSAAMFYEVEDFKNSTKYISLGEYFDYILHKDIIDMIDFLNITAKEFANLAMVGGDKSKRYQYHKMMEDANEIVNTLEVIKSLKVLVK